MSEEINNPDRFDREDGNRDAKRANLQDDNANNINDSSLTDTSNHLSEAEIKRIGEFKNDINSLENTLNNLKTLITKNQDTSKKLREDFNNEKKNLEQKINELLEQAQLTSSGSALIKAELEKVTEQLRNGEALYNTLNNDHTSLKQTHATLQNEMNIKQEELQKLRDDIDLNKNEAVQSLAKKEEQIAKLDTEIEELHALFLVFKEQLNKAISEDTEMQQLGGRGKYRYITRVSSSKRRVSDKKKSSKQQRGSGKRHSKVVSPKKRGSSKKVSTPKKRGSSKKVSPKKKSSSPRRK